MYSMCIRDVSPLRVGVWGRSVLEISTKSIKTIFMRVDSDRELSQTPARPKKGGVGVAQRLNMELDLQS